ncbi:Exocyst complex component SEC8 [Pseudozyma hubeiensis]|nr:Exocyst complex component SEC8 [Pseudozyma hubeiensis]
MSGRSNTIKDIRSKIKHENTSLGAGTAASSFSSARHQIPHVSEAFGQHPGSVSLAGATAYNPTAPSNPTGFGAGPSFVSLAPSDSISNYQGRPNHGHSTSMSQAYAADYNDASVGRQHQQQQQAGFYGRPASPSHQSTASFALDPAYATSTGNSASASHSRNPSRQDSSDPPQPHSPLRPARSMRRPTQAPEVHRNLATMSSSSTAQDRARIPPQRPQLQIPPVGSASRPAAGPASPARNGPGRDLLAASRSQGTSHSRNQSAQSIGSAGGFLGSHASPPSDRHTRTAQLMAQVTRTGTPSSQADSEDHEDIYGGISPIDAPSEGHGAALYSNHPGSNVLSVPGQRPQRDPRRQSGAPLGSLTEDSQPAALDSVLSALTSAGRKRQAARIMRGTTAEEESRRRRNEKKISETSHQQRKSLGSYVDRSDPRAFQSINAVLRKVEAEWPFVVNDQFNSVALALSMLDESSLGASRFEFDQVKHMIETALQGTVDDHYESFAGAITTHNSVLQSLTAAQTSVSGARRRLRDSREALGAKRADLVQMWQRSQAVKEALRLLDLVEHLKSVPDKLEGLMAEKRFLESVNLLVRSLKTIDKPEVVEVGATNDLRAYLKGQEGAMLEILIEELHNHLYLKSYFCDARWKSYSAGQDELPVVKFGLDYRDVGGATSADANVDSISGSKGSSEPLQLTQYLQLLRSRPTFDPNLASDIPDSALMTSTKSVSALTGELRYGSGGGASATSGMDGSISMGLEGIRSGGRYGADFEQNPEADSFLYIEMLLESLSRLGKLGAALEIISQRLAMEIHQLVDTTIDEVDARNEPLRRFSVALRPESVLLSSSSALARSFSESMRTSRSSFNLSKRPLSTMLRISAGETSALQREGETMRDLFWTLFSKLDAVLQGHRVVYEVAGMIASRAGFKDEVASKKLSGVGALLQVWKPVQQEVRTLLHDYLMDDEGANSQRNAVVSVNDVLRDHRFGRDRSKQLFKLADAGVKRVVGRREVGPLQRHQLAVTQALKASVPGLVSSIDAGGMGGARAGNQIIVSSAAALGSMSLTSGSSVAASAGRTGRGVEPYTGAGHRLLVKPDAFNVSVLFQPALAFVERVAAVMPREAAGETSRGFSTFLDEFVQDIFLPQLEDKVQTLFNGATSHSDSFAADPASRHLDDRPVVKSASNVIVLIDSLYSMLRTTPFHRESYSRLIVTVIVQFYQRCGERFRDLMTGEGEEGGGGEGERKYAVSASWAQRVEMVACLAEMREAGTSEIRRRELMAQEARFELGYAKGREAIGVYELTTSRKKLLALGCLQHSVEWFAANVGRLKAVSSGTGKDVREKRARARLSVVDPLSLTNRFEELSTTTPNTEEEELPLPLTPDLVARYSIISGVYTALSSSILFTLRLELRLRIITYLSLSITESSYIINDTATEPSPHIVDLNSELANLDDILTETLSATNRTWIWSGLSAFVDACFVAQVHKVKGINREGVGKMVRGVLAVQQNLKNILGATEVTLDRCRRFYELLYAKTPNELLASMKRFQDAFRKQGVKAVGFAELQAVLQLALGIEPPSSGSKPSSAVSGDKLGLVQPNAGTLGLTDGVSRQKLNEYLIELHEVAGDHDSDDE